MKYEQIIAVYLGARVRMKKLLNVNNCAWNCLHRHSPTGCLSKYFLHIHVSQIRQSTNNTQQEPTLEHGFVGRPRVIPLQLRQEPEHRAVHLAWLVPHQEGLFTCRKQQNIVSKCWSEMNINTRKR